MRRQFAAVFALIGLSLLASFAYWRPWQPRGEYLTAMELGYFIEYEVDPETMHICQSNAEHHWGGEPAEYVGVIVQKHYSMQVVNGRVTVNRMPLGRVEKGDRLRVTLDGRLWVNGVERRP